MRRYRRTHPGARAAVKAQGKVDTLGLTHELMRRYATLERERRRLLEAQHALCQEMAGRGLADAIIAGVTRTIRRDVQRNADGPSDLSLCAQRIDAAHSPS